MAQRQTTLRARDTDRVQTCGLLDAALGDGQLTDDEHRDRTRAAMSAKTLADLDATIADLQLPAHTTISRPAPRRPVPVRTFAVGTAAVTAAAVAAVVMLSGTDDAEPTPTAPVARAAPDTPAVPQDPYADVAPIVVERIDPLTATGVGKFRDAYLAKFGDTLVDDVTFYDEYVIAERVFDGEPRRSQDWSFRGGFAKSGSPNTGRDPDLPRLDLATVNLDALAGYLAGAAESVHVPNGTISHVSMSADDGPEVTIYVSNDDTGMSGYLALTPEGDRTRVSYGDR
ncbi:DUF1707 SHOCT-like domain-containing protein [Rhodococcus sp. NPDC003348]